LPVSRSRLCVEGFNACYTAGIQIEKNINELLIEDNKDLIKNLSAFKNNQNFQCSVIEDIKAKYIVVMQRE
jgi:hypothetical protein